MSTPREPKVRTTSGIERAKEQQRQLKELHERLAKRGVDAGGWSTMCAAMEERGGFEGAQGRRMSALVARLNTAEELLIRREEAHVQLHRLVGTKPCRMKAPCACEGPEVTVLDAEALRALGKLVGVMGLQVHLQQLRLSSGRLGPPGRDSLGAVATFLGDKAVGAGLRFTDREIGLLRLQARRKPLPFDDAAIARETDAVKKARVAHGRPPRVGRKPASTSPASAPGDK